MEQLDNSKIAQPAAPVGSGFSVKGLLDVITSPSSFFEKLKDNPKVLVPSIGIFVLAAIAMYLLKDLIIAAQLEVMRAGGQMTETQLRGLERSAFFQNTPMIGAVVVLVGPFIAGGLAMFVGNFIMSGKAKYWQLVSVMAYSDFVYFAGSMVALPLQVMKETLVPSFSLAVLAPDLSMQEPLFVLLSKISVPYVWELIVAGIGLSIIFQFSRNKGYLLAVLSIGTLSALHVLSAVAGQMAQ